jgi:hypothetical protein
MGETFRSANIARLGYILYWMGCTVAVASMSIFMLEAFALIDGRVVDLEKFLDPFAPLSLSFLPTASQAFGLAIGSWLLGLACRRLLAGETDRDLYLTAREVARKLGDS